MKQMCRRMIFIFLCFCVVVFFFLLSLEKLVVYAISFRLSEAELSMHLIPLNSFLKALK